MVHLYYLPRGHVFQLTDVGLVLSFPIHFGHAQIESYQMKLFLSPDGTTLTITAQEGKIVVLRYQGI